MDISGYIASGNTLQCNLVFALDLSAMVIGGLLLIFAILRVNNIKTKCAFVIANIGAILLVIGVVLAIILPSNICERNQASLSTKFASDITKKTGLNVTSEDAEAILKSDDDDDNDTHTYSFVTYYTSDKDKLVSVQTCVTDNTLSMYVSDSNYTSILSED